MSNESLLDSIKSLCKRDNITITTLEKNLGISQGLISRWGKTDPSLSKVIDVANYFKISLDELVRFNKINDTFINKLIIETENKNLKWHSYNDSQKNPKQFNNNYAKDQYINNDKWCYYKLSSGTETSFYAPIGNGFFSLYAYHEHHNTKKFASINLFIQADEKSDLIWQPYNTEDLIPLWLKVLSTLGEYAPDDIKAEELKHAFLSNNTSTPLVGILNHEIAHIIGSNLKEK